MRPDFLRLGAWCGVVSGLASLAVLALRHTFRGLTFYPLDSAWRIPLAGIVTMVGLALLFMVGQRIKPARFRWRDLLTIELFLAGYGALLRVPSLHAAASAVLAAGVAIQAARWAARHERAADRLIRLTLAPGAIALILIGASVPAVRAWREARAFQPAAPSAPRPNVLLIVWDTVRAWDLSAYGYAKPTTPRLAELASRGALFSRAVSPAPWTLPSHASLFTGRWPHELSTDWFTPLDGAFPTLAELLGASGYLTAGFCANVRYCSEETGLARGFAHYEDYHVPIAQTLNDEPLHQISNRVKSLFVPPPDEDWEGKSHPAPSMSGAFLAWLDAARARGTGQPFFAFVNFFDAHRPYTSPGEFHAPFSSPGAPFTPNLLPRTGPSRPWDAAVLQGSRDAYDASIAWLDREAGRLLDDLDRRGALSNTIVVITADHGEEFGEHGMIGHGNSLYRAGVMVPLVLVAPGLIPPGQRIDAAVSTRDLPRTLLDLTHGDAAGRIPGSSLAPRWQPSAAGAPPAEPVLSTLRYGPRLPDWYPVSHGPLRSVIDGGWRYIVRQDGVEELYDFDSDPLEARNAIATDAGRAIAARLRAILDSMTKAPSR